MVEIPRHKVFISYYHADDQYYKNKLLELNKYYNIFDDYSVHEDEIDDTGMTNELIRCEIRDKYIAGATVLILLCGKNTKNRKHIDWELHAAMYDSNSNPKMGILVINLPSIENNSEMRAFGFDEQKAMGAYINWQPASRDLRDIQNDHPYLADRIVKNLIRENVVISIANWNNIIGKTETIKLLIDNAFKRRNTNISDYSAPLKGRNS